MGNTGIPPIAKKLKKWYTKAMKELLEKEDTVTISRVEYDEMKAQIQYLMAQLRLGKHRQFGVSSEKSEYDQVNLFNEAEAYTEPLAPEPELCEVEKHYRRKRRETMDSIPDDIPVEVMEHVLPPYEQSCPACDGSLHVMGKEIVRRELKLIPQSAVIVEEVQYVYACRDCEQNGVAVPVVKAPMPEPVIKGSFAAPESIAHIMTQKFVMGVPLYRQEQEWKRHGILLSRQTMSNWLLKASEDWLEPIYDALKERLLAHDILHADETVLQVLREPGKSAQSKSYMWAYRTSGDTDQHIILLEYQPDRKAKRPEEFLKGFKGYLHTDGYEAYHKLSDDVTIVGCWAHARRKFDEALKILPHKGRNDSGPLIGKQYCDKLFTIERELAGRKLPPEDRHLWRQEQAQPVLDEFWAWLNSQRLTKSPFGKAVSYTLGQWKYLLCYLLDGRLEISNNRMERSIKPFVIDRKNFLFANTPRGAKASAVIFSIIETAKENGLNPYEYLTFMFRVLPNNAGKPIGDFLPGSGDLPERCHCPKQKNGAEIYVWEEN